jgi:hypothetical protein
MTLYVAIRRGVYRNNLLGVFTSEETALSAAELLLRQEMDAYHSVDILECEADAFSIKTTDNRFDGCNEKLAWEVVRMDDARWEKDAQGHAVKIILSTNIVRNKCTTS